MTATTTTQKSSHGRQRNADSRIARQMAIQSNWRNTILVFVFLSVSFNAGFKEGKWIRRRMSCNSLREESCLHLAKIRQSRNGRQTTWATPGHCLTVCNLVCHISCGLPDPKRIETYFHLIYLSSILSRCRITLSPIRRYPSFCDWINLSRPLMQDICIQNVLNEISLYVLFVTQNPFTEISRLTSCLDFIQIVIRSVWLSNDSYFLQGILCQRSKL